MISIYCLLAYKMSCTQAGLNIPLWLSFLSVSLDILLICVALYALKWISKL